MPCDCDTHTQAAIWVGSTLCSRCDACGQVRVTKCPPTHMEPPAFGPDDDGVLRWGMWIIAAFLAGAFASFLWALVTGP